MNPSVVIMFVRILTPPSSSSRFKSAIACAFMVVVGYGKIGKESVGITRLVWHCVGIEGHTSHLEKTSQ